ncbi:E3 ubiquitin-protein ligase hrd1 [Arthrobotrys conoides]|uniref:RING-type E3 ubiquitin transferase n=1 Tax=Arthrobotrys conoides TaxID=74498 RepID=A0AAN8RS29_9PEZI
MRLVAYGAISTLVASGVVLQAFHQRANFYSACVHLAQSNACVMILTNFGFFMTLMFGKMIQKIFYGPLRAAEVEHLYEKAWYAITETCLAMTIFRDEFHSGYVMMFTILLFLKCFHWLGNDRVDFMEQTPPDHPYLFHIRLAGSLISLLLLDLVLTRHCILTLMQLPKPNMLVMFAFEFAILAVAGSGTLFRYLIAIAERIITVRKTRLYRERRTRVLQRRVDRGIISEEEMRDMLLEEEEAGDVINAWEGKAIFLFTMEIATDLLKLLIYLAFFGIVLMFYGLPLHIVRDVYMTLRSFIGRCRDYIRFKRATQQMNLKYPDATREEIARENVCIICRETMRAWSDTPETAAQQQAQQAEIVDEEDIADDRMRPKKLPCGHVLHLACLKSWMERQQRCPTCRRPVLEEPDAAPNGQGGGAAGAQNFGGIAPPPGFEQANQPGQNQGQNPGQGPAPGQPGEPGNGPVRFGLNMFGNGGGGGFVQALARNLAQRQNQFQPFDQNAQGAQQGQQAQQNLQGQENRRPGQQNQLGQLGQLGQPNLPAQQNQPAQLNQPVQPNQPVQGLQAGPQALNHDAATLLYTRLAELMRVTADDIVRQQNVWNGTLLRNIGDVAEQLRQTQRALAINRPGFADQDRAEQAREAADRPPNASNQPNIAPSILTNPHRSTTSTPVSRSSASSAQVSSNHNINQAINIPPGLQLPPGWSVVPLFPVVQGSPAPSGFATPQQQQQGVVYTTPSPLPHQHQHHHQPSQGTFTPSATHDSSTQPSTSSASRSDISLSDSGIRRRGVQRQYSNNLHTYHSMASPRREESNPFAPSHQAPTSSSTGTTDTTSGITSSSSPLGLTRNQQTANNGLNNISSPPRQMNNSHNNHGTSSSPSRHGSISSTSREVLERRHRDAHSPRPGSSKLSPAGSVRSTLSNNNTHNNSTTDSSARRVSSPMGLGTATGNGRRSEHPHLDTSAEHNHPVDSTHNPTQGRSPVEERRRASAGEILLTETDTVWPAQAGQSASGPTSEGSLSPTPSLPSSRVGSVRRNRRSSGAGLTTAMTAGNGSPIGTTSIFNVIPKSQASSTVGSPVMGHSLGRFDLGSPTRMSLDKGKERDDSGNGGNESDANERGRSRIKEEDDET